MTVKMLTLLYFITIYFQLVMLDIYVKHIHQAY